MMTKISFWYTMWLYLFKNKYQKRRKRMRDYVKPALEEETIELKDIVAASNNGGTEEGESASLADIMGGIFS